MDKNVIDSLKSELRGPGLPISKIFNSLSFIHNSLSKGSWVGLYLFDKETGSLILGPFEGTPACEFIKVGQGVVGTCFASKKEIYVRDVSTFKGYISCDPTAKSEVVYPLWKGEEIIGVLDIDSPTIDGLKDDIQILEEASLILSPLIGDWRERAFCN